MPSNLAVERYERLGLKGAEVSEGGSRLGVVMAEVRSKATAVING